MYTSRYDLPELPQTDGSSGSDALDGGREHTTIRIRKRESDESTSGAEKKSLPRADCVPLVFALTVSGSGRKQAGTTLKGTLVILGVSQTRHTPGCTSADAYASYVKHAVSAQAPTRICCVAAGRTLTGYLDSGTLLGDPDEDFRCSSIRGYVNP